MSVKIVPNWETKGTDFFGDGDCHYVVRSDIGVFLKSKDLHSGEHTIFELHDACKGGTHYLAALPPMSTALKIGAAAGAWVLGPVGLIAGAGLIALGANKEPYFYIIKGNEYRRVKNLETDDDGTVFTLHPNCRGGTHYIGDGHNKYIIFADRNRYRKVTDMTEDLDAEEFDLHPENQGGLYYWACEKYKYFLKQSKWGTAFHQCTDLTDNSYHDFQSVHKTIISFLPGGLAVNIGPTYCKWKLLKAITNNTGAEVKWTKKITKKQGYNKEELNSTEHNWNISTTAKLSSGVLTESIAKQQFSLTASYGGKHVASNKESWSEATEVEETLELSLKTNESVNVWQYQIGMGTNEDKPILFCRQLELTETKTPPSKLDT